MLADWALLQIFGASSWALRVPSLLAAAGLLLAGVWFLRLRGCSRSWQLIGLAALASQGTLMYHAGEARPYMPLAAATVGALAYYALPLGQRGRWPAIVLGTTAIVGGALVHPYFPLMLGLVGGFSLWMALRDGTIRRTTRELVTFANPVLLTVAGAAYLVIGRLTWMRGSPIFALDPYEMYGSPLAMLTELLTRHVEFMVALPVAVVVGLFGVFSIRGMAGHRRLVGPLSLVVVGLSSSLIVSLASIARSYWVFPRQWVAGMALVALGLVWMFSEIDRAIAAGPSRVRRIPVLIFQALVVATFTLSLVGGGIALAQYRADWTATPLSPVRPLAPVVSTAMSNDQWVQLANANVKEGGRVWPQFAALYDRQG
jgi:hypothetical protein